MKQPTCIHRPSISDQGWVATIFESSVRATAWLHMPTASAMTLMPGFLANTSLAAAVRAVSTEVAGTPVMTTMLPLPPSLSTSHWPVFRPASSWSMVAL